MCRVMAYLGDPVALNDVLFEADSSLVRQSYSPRMMATFLNLAGFGMVAWDQRSARPEQPFSYRVTTLPAFDRNLRNLADKLEPTCLVAHVRGVTYSGRETVATTNLHPFHFPGTQLALAHNGHLRNFATMRFDLIDLVRRDVARHISGTTDSEWVYALILSQLEDPYGMPEMSEVAEATVAALRLLRGVRAKHGIDTSSPVNLCLTNGRGFLATRFSFDYGWYPSEDSLLETDLPYVSLWYTTGGEYRARDGTFGMTASSPARSVLVASEPLTLDTSTWLEVPEYSIITAERTADGTLRLETRDLDA
jgi:glutamine amidotransferase